MWSSGPASRRALLAVAIVFGSACNSDKGPAITGPNAQPLENARGVTGPEAAAALSAVMAGNAQAVAAAPALVPPGAPLAPFIESRLYAIANVAIHDALNAIVPRYERYADTGPIEGNANVAAAVLTAAHDAIVGADPAAQAAIDAWYEGAIAEQSGSAANTGSASRARDVGQRRTALRFH